MTRFRVGVVQNMQKPVVACERAVRSSLTSEDARTKFMQMMNDSEGASWLQNHNDHKKCQVTLANDVTMFDSGSQQMLRGKRKYGILQVRQ